MITTFDDYMIHQTSDPVTQPEPSDRNFYDRYWFSGFDREGAFMFEVGFAIYPNRKVMDGHFSFVQDGEQHTFHASRRAPRERREMQVGPLEIEVVSPMRAVRVKLGSNETGIECDLLFRASTFPHLEPKNVMHDEGRLIMETSRFTQAGSWEGFAAVGGDRVVVNAETTPGIRDKSWGVRPVGEPEAGAPGLMTTEPGVYWVWAPALFDDTCTQFGTFEDHDGNATQVSGHRVPLYASSDAIPAGEDPGIETMKSAAHKVQWKKGTRLAERVELEFTARDGEVLQITMEPMIRFQMLGIGYQHPEWGHGRWQGEEVIASESWVLDDLDLLDYKHIHNHQACRVTLSSRQGEQFGVGLVETIAFGRHDPSGFKSILDGAPG